MSRAPLPARLRQQIAEADQYRFDQARPAQMG
jgi:hypothetical protein